MTLVITCELGFFLRFRDQLQAAPCVDTQHATFDPPSCEDKAASRLNLLRPPDRCLDSSRCGHVPQEHVHCLPIDVTHDKQGPGCKSSRKACGRGECIIPFEGTGVGCRGRGRTHIHRGRTQIRRPHSGGNVLHMDDATTPSTRLRLAAATWSQHLRINDCGNKL
jgi:hypothetical protein